MFGFTWAKSTEKGSYENLSKVILFQTFKFILTVASSFFHVIVASFFWQFFAKLGITANESIHDLSKKQEHNHGDLEV